MEPTKLCVTQPVFSSASRPAEGLDAGAGADQAAPHRTRAHGGSGTGQGAAVLGRTTGHAIADSGSRGTGGGAGTETDKGGGGDLGHDVFQRGGDELATERTGQTGTPGTTKSTQADGFHSTANGAGMGLRALQAIRDGIARRTSQQ